ncbi:MAG: hypothetical protein ACRDPF_04425 [Streptosporangiaceae bacterium]
MNTGYTIYQVERAKSAAEQREIDRSNAQLAAAISRLWRALAVPLPARRAARRRPVRDTAPRVSAETPHAIAPGVSAGTLGHAAMRNGPGARPDGRGQCVPVGTGHRR